MLSDNTPPITYGIYQNFNHNSNKNIGNNKKPPIKGDNDLISSMATRLKQLELTCNSQREELKDKVESII